MNKTKELDMELFIVLLMTRNDDCVLSTYSTLIFNDKSEALELAKFYVTSRSDLAGAGIYTTSWIGNQLFTDECVYYLDENGELV